MAKNLTPPLTLLHWDLTNACNFRCVFCLNNSGASLPDELSIQDKFLLLNEAHSVGVRYLRLLGGEPFIREETIEIIRTAANNKMFTLISTNGSLIDRTLSKQLSSVGGWLKYIQVSLYGICSDDYEIVCGKGQYFERVCSGIEFLIESGLNPTLLMVVSRHNIDRIPDFYYFARQIGARSLRLALATPIGRGASCSTKSTCIDRAAFYGSLKQVCEEADSSIPIETTEYPYLADLLETKTSVRVMRLSCTASLTSIYIGPNGHARPCPFTELESETKNETAIRFPESTLEVIWSSPCFQEFRALHEAIRDSSSHSKCKYLSSGKCQPCPMRQQTCQEIAENLSWNQKIRSGE